MLVEEQASGSSAVGRRLLRRLIRPHRVRIAALLAMAVVQSGLAAAGPWLVGVAIDTAISDARAADYRPLALVGLALLGCAVASTILMRRWQLRAGELGQLVVFDLRGQLFACLQRLPVAFHERLSSGRVVARMTTDIESVNALFGATLTGLLQAAIGLAVTTVAMLLLDAALAVETLVALVIPVALLTAWTLRRLRSAFGRYRGALADVTVQVVESVNGARAVHAFRRQPRNDEVLGRHVERARASEREIEIARGVYWPVLELIFSVAMLVVVLVGGLQVEDGRLEVGVLAAFILYVAQFFAPVSSLAFTLDAVQSARVALDKIGEVLEREPEVREPRLPVPLPQPSLGEVVFDGVTFDYGGGASGDATIPDLDLRLAAGEVVAMLGATGAGKSTIAELIARFYDPQVGSVRLDGVDLRHLADRDLRRAVVLLTQEVFLFAGSVADNIRLARPAATRAEVRAAAAAVGADAFVDALPDGYDTDVRKHGTRLSAGQRQLVAFARTFLADPAVLILDEATAALDIPTERAMQEAMRTLLSGRTALIIAHRLSTVEMADRVLVLAGGRLVDDGTPAELLANGTGEFAALYRDGHGQSL